MNRATIIGVMILLFEAMLVTQAEFYLDKSKTIFSSPSTDELTKKELMKRLASAKEDEVAGILFKAKNKDTTEVSKGVTVSDLLALNTIRLNECRLENSKRRSELCSKLSKSMFKPYPILRRYCQLRIAELDQICLEMAVELFPGNYLTSNEQ